MGAMMQNWNWSDTIDAAVTVSDTNGKIIYMNHKSADVFSKSGGMDLVGKSVFDCHSAESVQKIHKMLQTGLPNQYTIQKNGKKKMILQTPFFADGKVAGLVEITFDIPESIPHFNRDAIE
jgi:transcriptional regulator with PAS, ATPase and Fis domain